MERDRNYVAPLPLDVEAVGPLFRPRKASHRKEIEYVTRGPNRRAVNETFYTGNADVSCDRRMTMELHRDLLTLLQYSFFI